MKLYGQVIVSNIKCASDLSAMVGLIKCDECAKPPSQRLTQRRTSMAFGFVLDNMGYK